jgi:DNA-binding CsgD family transcriptional regulator
MVHVGFIMPEFTNSRLSRFLSLLLLALTVVGMLDLIQDAPKIWNSSHVLIEVLFILLSLGSAIFLWIGWRSTNSSLKRTRKILEAHQAEKEAWRIEAQAYLKGLGEVISKQFKEWGLTAAESETALLLLKGFSHKEIGILTGKSERTVRQHGIAVYRKSGLAGRAELAAFFLEDLLLPPNQIDRSK